MTLFKRNTPVPSWTVVYLVNFFWDHPLLFLAVSCPSLLQGSHWHRPIHIQQSLQLHPISCYQWAFTPFSAELYLTHFSFPLLPHHPGTPLPSSLCTVLLLKILINSLSSNRRYLLLTDIWHRVNLDNSAERDSLLLWHASIAGCLRETDVPPALLFPPSSPALLLPPLQTRQNIRHRYQESSWLAVVHMVLHMMVITTDLVKQNIFLLSLSRKPLLFWNTSGFPKITNDKAQIRHILWFYNARASTHIFRIEIDIIFFIDDT